VAAGCTQLVDAPEAQGDVIVVTAGSEAPAPVGGGATLEPQSNLQDAGPKVVGTSTNPVTLPGDGCTLEELQPVTVTIGYTVRGSQSADAYFDVYTEWTYDGTTFIGDEATTIKVPAASGPPRDFQVDITVTTESPTGQGTTSFDVAPFNLQTTGDEPGQRLNLTDTNTATVHVEFRDCETQDENKPPVLTLPKHITEEATSSQGAAVGFTVSAQDEEDGDLPVTCSVGDEPVFSGGQFPIGDTEVTCSVTDSGGLTTTGSFHVYVQDTIAPEFTVFPSNVTVVATDINGYTLDLSAFTIEAKDFGPLGEAAGEVSPPVTITCTIGDDPGDGYQIAIGQTATVSCVAADSAEYRAPVPDGETAPDAPNVSAPMTFDVFVTLDVSGSCGFEPPLRNAAPYSAHKINSTIPHKFCPPAYADGTPATDLAGGLKLVLTKIDSQPDSDVIEANDFAAGSTAWRYDDGHYILNLKTDRSWSPGQYQTTVSYNGIVLASTELALTK